ncbi:MAG: glycosyltransferase family 39 protein [Planctomycetes bacterium]|nr:glycosyltransferase family 39 protein [Planctomycetota bacterium]
MNKRANAFDWVVFGCLAVVTVGLAVNAGNADFTYPDASRHAADGVFVLDAAAELPIDHPLEWAGRYYLTSPAIGIGRYPPLFAAVQAPFYAALGVCPLAGRLAVALVWLGGLVFFYETLRRGFGQPAAAFAAAVLAAGPASVRWGGEVMLELPATAFLLVAAFLYKRYVDEGAHRLLTWCVIFIGLAGWVKQPAILLAVPIAVHLLVRKRSLRVFAREMWPGFVALVILTVPLAALSARFGRANVMLVAGAARQYGFFDAGNWLYYPARVASHYLGWPCTVFLVVGLVWALIRKVRADALLWALWAGVFYLFFSIVGYKSARLAMFWTPALAYFAGAAFAWLTAEGRRRQVVLVAVAAVIAVGWTFVHNVQRLPAFSGQSRRAAELALAERPKRILYSGERNGTFIFRVRQIAGRKRPTVVRASKVFFVDAIQKEIARTVRPWTTQEIKDEVAKIAPDVVVVEGRKKAAWQPDAIVPFLDYVQTANFELVGRARATGNPRPDIYVYRYLGPRRPGAMEIPMPGVGVQLDLPPEGR